MRQPLREVGGLTEKSAMSVVAPRPVDRKGLERQQPPGDGAGEKHEGLPSYEMGTFTNSKEGALSCRPAPPMECSGTAVTWPAKDGHLVLRP